MEPQVDRAAVVDVLFAVDGTGLPADYRFELMREIARCLPWLTPELGIGIHPIRAARADDGHLLLPKRARLVVRLPEAQVADAAALCGRRLDVGGWALTVGAAAVRNLVPHGTLYAHLVSAGAEDEQAFMAETAAALRALETPCKLVCGKRQSFAAGRREIVGYSLMLHDLRPEHSLRVQQLGLGGDRMLGCGIFVPHRSAAAVGTG